MSTKNGRSTTMRWNDVTDLSAIVIYNQQLRSSFYTYTLKDPVGQTMRLNLTPGNFENADQLAQTIQQEVTRRQLAQAAVDFNAGTPIQFGPLTVTQEGIENGRKTLPWSDFKEVTLGRNGNFIITHRLPLTDYRKSGFVWAKQLY